MCTKKCASKISTPATCLSFMCLYLACLICLELLFSGAFLYFCRGSLCQQRSCAAFISMFLWAYNTALWFERQVCESIRFSLTYVLDGERDALENETQQTHVCCTYYSLLTCANIWMIFCLPRHIQFSPPTVMHILASSVFFLSLTLELSRQ